MVGAVAVSASPLSAQAASSTRHAKEKKMQASNHATFKVDNTALVLVDHQVGTIGWAGDACCVLPKISAFAAAAFLAAPS